MSPSSSMALPSKSSAACSPVMSTTKMDRKSNMKDTEPLEPMFPPPRSRAYLMSGAVRLRLSVRQVMSSATPPGA